MIRLNSSKKLDLAFKNSTLCNGNKKEGEVLEAEAKKITKNLDDIKEKIIYLKEELDERGETVIAVAMLLYPKKKINEAITMLYEDIKLINEKYDIKNEKIVKYIRMNKEFEEELESYELKKTIVKAAYIESAIKSAKECDIF